MEQNRSVIILSDDEDDEDSIMQHNDSSVLIIENEINVPDVAKNIEKLDEDLAITYSQTATVLPHARYDCTLPFCRSEQDLSGPLQNNAMHCDQCFCYICDKLVSTCEFWTIPGICHCNAHKHSVYWKSLRNKSIMGYLHELNFTFDPQDMDSDLRHAETSLQKFAGSLALKYATFLNGFENPTRRVSCRCNCHRGSNSTTQSQSSGCKGCQTHHLKILDFDYSLVSQHIGSFLDEANKANPKACVVMLLGAIKLFSTHTAPGNTHAAKAVLNSVSALLWRVMTRVWKLLVDFEFSTSFIKQLQFFYQRLPALPSNCALPNSLNVLPWADPLLSAVMKGQNVTGERKVKGRRTEFLCEHFGVIRARVCNLQRQKKYREMARYLRVVISNKSPTLQKMRDLVPFYLCKVGDYSGAIQTMLSPMLGASCPASRLTSPQFRAYLRILTSGHAPDSKESDFNTTNPLVSITDPLLSTVWTPIKVASATLLKKMEVLKFALRVLDCNSDVFGDAESWVYLLSVVSSAHVAPDGLIVGEIYAEPNLNFQMVTRDIANSVLEELRTPTGLQIPKTFENGYPDQARLLLGTQALALRIFHSPLAPILNVIVSFRLNLWALRWMFYSLLVRPDVLQYLLCSALEELFGERYKPVLRKWSESEHSFIAYFLCLYFKEEHVVLDPNTYPINNLIAMWNELHYPWQLSLRLQLESTVASLTQQKRQILQKIQCKSFVPTS